ncbi:MAG: hypothetical protein JKY02_05380 [Flavobacteriaceae bacterium]|nr:hypothetical protein [Flavobacteriaceae bacterium]
MNVAKQKITTQKITKFKPKFAYKEVKSSIGNVLLLSFFNNYPRNIKPLPPIAQACLTNDKTQISVSAIVFVGLTELDNPIVFDGFNIIQEHVFSNEGVPEIELDICYSSVDQNLEDFVPVLVQFETEPIEGPQGEVITLEKVKTITSYLKNVDPEGSRGTVTTVQSDDD